MDWYFIAYVFFCMVTGLGLYVLMFRSGRMWSLLALIILTSLIFTFFSLRWFSGNTSFFSYKGSWPPIINMCPDYLVYYKNQTVDSCIDLVGVNNSNGKLQAWSKDDVANPPQAADKYFPYVYRPGMTGDQLANLCQRAMEAGLTWEGITNGESCTYTSSPA